MVIVENLDTFLPLPAMSGVVAVFGHGDEVGSLARIAWDDALPVLRERLAGANSANSARA
ncbi:MAG: Wadjet anti-phage system protein JetD domain-containing protein [Pseudoclavibacter sp.]